MLWSICVIGRRHRGRSKQWDAVDGVRIHAHKLRNTVYFAVYYMMIVALWQMTPYELIHSYETMYETTRCDVSKYLESLAPL
jgi:hypothetical protein